ncbi:DUF697 domain-containing protein [Parabacteroides pacaensis]|uniref:DUF697 domain-containing protein n=1 Tax=Parabacteroides pacaensis TaxID=2086575 RepID=UPI000D10F45D|nr:DUF697 domain-containing protein [Parabacteroides pacaensis]
MKRNFIFLIGIFVSIAGLMLVGNIIIIGERLARVHPTVEYLFYMVLLALTVVYIIIPVIRVMKTPGIPAFDEERLKGTSSTEVCNIGILLAKNNYYIKDPGARKSHRKYLLDYFNLHVDEKELVLIKIADEMEKRLRHMDHIIKEQALTVFLISALSQNGKFDFISALVINFKMIKQIVLTSGFRPTYTQLIRIYIHVLSASFITYFSDEMLDDIDFSSLANTLHVPGIFISSLIDGTVTALMTLRIGYIAKMYIQTGSEAFNKRTARRYGLKNARKEIIEVAKLGVSKLHKSAVNGFISLFKGKKRMPETGNF